jgi:general secretion pathway protein K
MMRHDSQRQGFALVMVLWTIALLTALALAMSLMFRSFAGLVATSRDAAKADMLLRGGLEFAAATVKGQGARPLVATVHVLPLGGGGVRVVLSDDGGRINVNRAAMSLLAALFQAAGVPSAEARAIAQATVAWRIRNGADPSKTAQVAAMTNMGIAPFVDLRQLAQVPGMRADYLAAVMPLATVFGDDRINVMTAPDAVIGALPGISAGARETLLATRQLGVRAVQNIFPSLGNGQAYLKWDGKPIARADLTATLPDGYIKMAQAIIVVVAQDSQPFRILAWTPLSSASE